MYLLVVVLEDKFMSKSARLKRGCISLPGRLGVGMCTWCRNEIFMPAQVPESKTESYTKFLRAPPIILPGPAQVFSKISCLTQADMMRADCLGT